ncbi:hypothetical protein [Asaia sp. As-1742]|uniref:hypothetical protein n=1 Tax=Asaia sp. As-1742 TaxID=2608325 RepID=UPI00141E4B28|nr:hypothetical protein [Asaia sp. As-1742]NIE80454.1 hypothetical protein [Asaia sp. As-1742]
MSQETCRRVTDFTIRRGARSATDHEPAPVIEGRLMAGRDIPAIILVPCCARFAGLVRDCSWPNR